MATYTVETVTAAGLEATANAVSASDDFANNGSTLLRVINGSGGDITVTIVSSFTRVGLALADQPVTVTAGEARWVGPFDTSTFGTTTTVTYSATTSVTAECVKYA